MPKITFVEFDGTVHEVEGECGRSLMRAAVDNYVPGIDADCGGECSCATCHVMLSEEWFAVVGEPHAAEDEMLSMIPERDPHSRLSCQIEVHEGLTGIVVNLPEFQF
ncbi:MAG: 2Fe-2S iron-sulfur cluster binding domain-containing protein [Pseudomonadales bacterium]|nr:2Fe-2S iron-sulfur cluster binding domain-containing protein [Pseudomonadales bacterium]